MCDAQGKQCRPTGEEPGEGISDADFVFYVSAMDTERCQKGMTVAYAAHCQQESSLDRSERLRSRFFLLLIISPPPPNAISIPLCCFSLSTLVHRIIRVTSRV